MISTAAIENDYQTEIDRLAIEMHVKQSGQVQSKKRSMNVVNSSETMESKILLNVPTIINNQSDENSSQEVDVKQVDIDLTDSKNLSKSEGQFEESKRSWKKSIELNESSNGANSKASNYSRKKSK